MYKATFQAGWKTIECEGETLESILGQFMMEQDLECLVQMGKYCGMGDEDDMPVFDAIEKLLRKFQRGTLKKADIRKMDYSLSIGTLKCISIEKC